MATRVTMLASMRFVKPGSAFGSKITVGRSAPDRGQHHRARRRSRPRRRRRHTGGGAELRAESQSPAGQKRNVLQERHAAKSLPARRANHLERETRRRNEFLFQAALCPDEEQPSRPASRDSHSRATASAGNTCPPVPPPAISSSKCCLTPRRRDHSACWLIFRSTPVARSITSRLDPP